jgi:hypothetical protein
MTRSPSRLCRFNRLNINASPTGAPPVTAALERQVVASGKRGAQIGRWRRAHSRTTLAAKLGLATTLDCSP